MQSGVDWVTAIGGAATALFTAALVYIGWKQSQRGLVAEWHFEEAVYDENQVKHRIYLTLRNSLRFSVTPERADVSGVPVFGTLDGDGKPKDYDTYPPSACPLEGRPIEPGQSGERSLSVFVDWSSLSDRMSSRWLFTSSATLTIRITVSSRAHSNWRRRIATSIKIPAEIIQQNAARAAQTSDDKTTSKKSAPS